jgi:glutamyl-tRNA reductase
VSPAVNDLEGCFVYDIDDLQQVAVQNQAVRSREAEAAESIVTSEVALYTDRLAQAPVTEAIKLLLAEAEVTRLAEMARLTAGEGMTAEQVAAVDRLTRSLTAKLLHPQIAALKGRRKDAGE